MFAILVCILVWCAPVKLEHFQLELAIYNALLGRRRISWKQLCFPMHKLPLLRSSGRMLRWLAKWTCHGLFRAVWPITWSLRASHWGPEQASIPIKVLFVRSKICSKISRRNLLQYTRFPWVFKPTTWKRVLPILILKTVHTGHVFSISYSSFFGSYIVTKETGWTIPLAIIDMRLI